MVNVTAIHQPEGWLISPDGKNLLHFFKDPMTLTSPTHYYSDLWSVSPVGIPNKYRNRRRAGLEPTLETWNELVQNGWMRIDSRFGPEAA